MIVRDFLAPLMDSWFENEWRLDDSLRGAIRLGELIGSNDYLFYPLDKTAWIMLGDTETVILGTAPVQKVRRKIKALMDELEMSRLTAYVPSGAVDYISYLKQIGFKVEGRMKQAGTYNSEPSDLVVCGFLPHYKVGRKRQRRSRRA